MTASSELGSDGLLHVPAVKLPVRLGARPLYGWPLGAVQHAELNARQVGDASHQPIERIDLAHEMPFAEAADGGIAGHLADRVEPVREERGSSAHPRSGGGGFTAGMAAPYNNDVEKLYAHGMELSVQCRR